MNLPTNFRLSALAKKDLNNIFKYTIRNWGEVQAKEYAQKLSDGFDLLSQKPNIGKSRENLYQSALSLPIGSHIIFYAINKDLDTKIEIARILHKRMDIENQLKS